MNTHIPAPEIIDQVLVVTSTFLLFPLTLSVLCVSLTGRAADIFLHIVTRYQPAQNICSSQAGDIINRLIWEEEGVAVRGRLFRANTEHRHCPLDPSLYFFPHI